jgi:uncharacterized protein (TIGR03086 family)
MSEIADRYRRLTADFAAAIEAVPADRWSAPTPCEGWTALDLVQHVVDSQSIMRSMIGREPTGAPPAADDPLASFRSATAVVQADLDDPAIAETPFTGLMGETTYEAAIDRFANTDLVVHRWDLARATGGDERLDAADVERVVEVTAGFDEQMMRSPGVFGPEVAVPDGADAQTKMLGILGRRA